MRLDRRTFVKGAGVAAGAALTAGTAAGFIDDGIDTDGGLQDVIVVFEDNDDVDALDGFDLADGHTEANMGAGFVDAAAAVERARELGRRAGDRGEDETKPDHPQQWNQVDLCEAGRGVAVPDVQGSRTDDGSTFTAGQVNHVEFTLTDSTHRLSRVRDVIPASWEVVAGDHAEVVEVFDAKYVYFDVDYDGEGETSFGYIVETPAETGQYGFGPAEAIAEDGESFVPIPDTEDTNAVVGQEQPDL